MARQTKVLSASIAIGLAFVFLAVGCSSTPPTSSTQTGSFGGDQQDRVVSLLEAGAAARASDAFDAAVTHYKEAIAISPRSLEAWLGLADAELAGQHNEAAAEAFRSAQVIEDGNPEAAYRLGQIALRAGDPSVAVDEFEQGLKTHKDDPRLNNGAAVAYAIEGRYGLARHYYDAALAQEPDNPSLRNNYGLLQLQSGDLDGALATFTALNRLAPTNNRYRINLALAYLALGKTSTALANAPGLSEEQLRRVLAALDRGKSAPALALLNTPASPIAPRSAEKGTVTSSTEEAPRQPESKAAATEPDTAGQAPSPGSPSLAAINPAAGAISSQLPPTGEPVRPITATSATGHQVVATPRKPSAAGAYKIQVGSVRDESGARQEWQRLLAHQRDVLGDLSLMISRADLGSRGVYYRIQAGPIAGSTEADQRCDALHNRNVGCIVLRP